MELPKKYLSYSAMSMWEKSPYEFRQKYYENKKPPESPEIIFGKKIAKLLETRDVDGDPILSMVPRYSVPEHKIEVMVEDVPVLGYLDSFEPKTNSFLEYKTGRPMANGAARWDRLSVAKHEQLDIYSLLIQLKYGSVDRHCKLIWIPTRYKKELVEFDGKTLEAKGNEIQFSGSPPQIFERTIYQWERDRIKEKIIRIAHEIELDWKEYRQRGIGDREKAGAVAASQKSLAA